MKVSHSASITLLNILVLLLLSLPALPNEAFASNLIYLENFDDKTVNAPPLGYLDEIKGPYWWAPGRGGTGYSFSGEQNVAALVLWWLNQRWPTDEMYVSFWFRYANFKSTDSHENIKMFYPHYGNSGYTTCTLSTPDWNHATIRSDSGTYIEPGNKIDLYFQGQTNGQWHHFEYWIKFSTAQIKYWYDGVLKAERNYPDNTDGVATWSGYVKYITLGSIDAEEPGTFMRQFDDWEVWDGMPGSRSTSSVVTKEPSPPQSLAIQ